MTTAMQWATSLSRGIISVLPSIGRWQTRPETREVANVNAVALGNQVASGCGPGQMQMQTPKQKSESDSE